MPLFILTSIINKNEDLIGYINPQLKKLTLINFFEYKKYNLYAHTSSWMFKNIFKKTHSNEFTKKKLFGDLIRSMTYLKFGDAHYIPNITTAYRIINTGTYTKRSKFYKTFFNDYYAYYLMCKLTDYKYFSVLCKTFFKYKKYIFIVKSKELLKKFFL